MAERYQKVVKVSSKLEDAYSICQKVCTNSKMTIKNQNIVPLDSFYILASEKTNWLSTSWPTRIEICGSIHNDKVHNDKVIIEVTADSSLGSFTQGNANARKLDGIVESIKAYLE